MEPILPSLQPSKLQVPQSVASSPSPHHPRDSDSNHSLAFQNGIAHYDQPRALVHETYSESLEATSTEPRPEGLGPLARYMIASQASLPLHSHPMYRPYDTDIESTLPIQAPRVRIESRERPLERIPRDLIPIPASSVMRYNRKTRIRSSRSRYTIQPGTKKFSDATLCPLGWEALTHPEGALYFYNAERRIFTDANLYKHKNVDVITTCADRIFEIAMAQDIGLPENVELTLEIMDERKSGLWRCGYYFADPSNRSIFWVHPFQAEPLFGNVKGVKSPGHIKYAVESQYCFLSQVQLRDCMCRMHCEFFPNNRSVDERLFLEVKEIIVHAISETITSDTSLVPFGRDDLSKMLEITSCLEGSVNKIRPHSMCVLARFMRTISRSKFFNFCGQVGARLDADQTVYLKGRRRRSILLNIASPLLFGAPYIHAQGLNAICVDQLVNHISWKRFIDKLNSEWEAFTLYSTIILNANIAFLAVPNVNHAARISSYVSTVSSVGAIILGLLLMRRNRTHKRDSAEDAVIFMTRTTHSLFGKEMLAIVYSMPYAFLLWGLIFFVLAFAFLVFQYSDRITRALVGCAVGLVTLFVIWAVWDSCTALWWLYPIRQRIKRNFQYWAMRNRLFGKVTLQPSARPSREEGALMPPDNDSESVATDSDSED